MNKNTLARIAIVGSIAVGCAPTQDNNREKQSAFMMQEMYQTQNNMKLMGVSNPILVSLDNNSSTEQDYFSLESYLFKNPNDETMILMSEVSPIFVGETYTINYKEFKQEGPKLRGDIARELNEFIDVDMEPKNNQPINKHIQGLLYNFESTRK